MFIVFAGIDGSGKTAQSKKLSETLQSLALATIHTHAPGGTPFGMTIRKMVLNAPQHHSVDAEALLFLADRAEHVDSIIRPALKRGEIVVCDRYTESTLVYQAPRMRGDGNARIMTIHNAMDWPVPDLVFHMKIPAAEAARRCRLRRSSDPDPNLDQLTALERRYDECITLAGGRVHCIDATRSVIACASTIFEIVASALAVKRPSRLTADVA